MSSQLVVEGERKKRISQVSAVLVHLVPQYLIRLLRNKPGFST
jgi:hypothetical protein